MSSLEDIDASASVEQPTQLLNLVYLSLQDPGGNVPLQSPTVLLPPHQHVPSYQFRNEDVIGQPVAPKEVLIKAYIEVYNKFKFSEFYFSPLRQ